MERLKKFGWRWGPALIMMGVIFWASDTPGANLPRFGVWDTLVKKGGHALGYALLAAGYLRGLTGGRAATRRELALAVALAGLYGMTDEFHQTFTSGRSPSLLDVAIDTAGAALGVLARMAGPALWQRWRAGA